MAAIDQMRSPESESGPFTADGSDEHGGVSDKIAAQYKRREEWAAQKELDKRTGAAQAVQKATTAVEATKNALNQRDFLRGMHDKVQLPTDLCCMS